MATAVADRSRKRLKKLEHKRPYRHAAPPGGAACSWSTYANLDPAEKDYLDSTPLRQRTLEDLTADDRRALSAILEAASMSTP